MKRTLLLILGLLLAVATCRAQVTDPGWYLGCDLTNVTPVQSYTSMLASKGISPMGFTITSSDIAEAVTPEISALARGLENNPKRIFDYVHDHIRYVLYFGSKKGAQLTLLERSGNDFDQCALLVALLRAAGYPNTSYGFGFMKIPYASTTNSIDLKNWLGLNCPTNASWSDTYTYLNLLLINRGFAQTFDEGNNYISFQRVWVTLNWGGTNYLLDPAFKISVPVAGIDLATVMQLNTSNLLAATSSTNSVYTTNYVQNLNEGQVRSTLQGYTSNLLAALQTTYSNYSVLQVTGGRLITPNTNATLRTSLWFPTTTRSGVYPLQTWTNQPTNFMASFTVSLGGTNHSWFTPQLQGSRLALTISSSGTAQLSQDDTVVLQTSNTGSGPKVSVTLSGHFPYAGWDTVNNVPSTNASRLDYSIAADYRFDGSYALLYCYEISPEWLHARQQKLDWYRQNYSNTSPQVVTETLNVMGLNWLFQTERNRLLLAQQNGLLSQNHTRLGRMSQETGHGYYVDVYYQTTGLYPNSGVSTADLSRLYQAFDLNSYFASAMEHGLIEQLQDTNLPAASTMKLIELASTNHQAIYLLNKTNWTAVTSQLVNYDTNDLYGPVQSGYNLLLPINGSISLAGAGSWTGSGYVRQRTSSDGGRNIGMYIGTSLFGAYSTYPNSTISPSYVTQSGTAQPNYNFPASALNPPTLAGDPVNMADATLQVSMNDLAFGSGEPRGVQFSRFYSSALRGQNPAGMAAGWVHNYYFNATGVSAPVAGLGGTTPQQMAPMLVATISALKLYTAQPDPRNWLTTALISKWGIDQLIKNAVSITMGKDTIQFVKQPDGSFTPPANCTMTLIQTNSTYQLQERHGKTFKFDTLGRLANIVDQYNQSLAVAYISSTSSLPQSVTDWKGRTLTFTYTNTPARLASVSASVSDGTRTVKYGYNASSNLVTVTDAEGKTSSYSYDTNHQIIATYDALSRLVVSNIYDNFGRVTTQYTQGDTNKAWQIFWSGWETVEQDPTGGQRHYFYDDQTRLVGTQDALGHIGQTVYDGQDHAVLTISPLGETNQFIYDGNHNLIQSIDPLGYANWFIYDANNNLVQTVDALTHTNRLAYNAKFQLTGSTNAAGDWYTLAYDSTTGNPTGRTDAGGTTSYGYDSYGQLNSITHPGGLGGEGFLNNAWGDVLSHTNARSFVTSFQYNSRRELTNTIAPTNLTASVIYDSVGNVLSTIDARGNMTSNTWSTTRKLLAMTLPTTPQGTPVITSVYDSRDWLMQTLNPLQKITSFTNDAAQRLLAVTDPLLRTTTFGYDADGRKLATTNAVLEKVLQAWNARGELTQATDNAGHTVGHRFDAAGNQITLTNRNTQRWQFQFDLANRLTNTISPLGRSNVITLDARGLVQTSREPSGQTTTLSYDAKGRLTSLVDGVTNRLYFYDANNNVTNIVEGGKTNAWTYDAYDRVSSYKDANGNLIQYQYDGNGNLTGLVYPGNRTVTYAYDNLNRLTTITDWVGRQSTVTYDLAGQVTRLTRPNNTIREINYNEAGQTTNIVEKLTSNFPIAFYRFQWDDAGRAQWEFGAPLPHAYTPPTRLMIFDADNRLTTFSMASVSNDLDGNLTYAPLTNSVMATYSYDARNRLLSAGGVTNAYDPAGNRVGVGTATLVVNPNAKLSQVLMRTRAGVTTYYVYGLGLLYEVDETATSTNTLTYHYDYRGSTVALTDGNGNVTDRIEYSAYGMTTYRAGTNDTPFLFNGRYGVMTDASGLLCMRARFYSPYLSRFISADPSGFSGGLNFYAYADGNPVSMTDPFGLNAGATGESSWTWFNAGVKAPAGWGYDQLHNMASTVSGLTTEFLGTGLDILGDASGINPRLGQYFDDLSQTYYSSTSPAAKNGWYDPNNLGIRAATIFLMFFQPETAAAERAALTPEQLANLARFEKKLPANATPTKFFNLPNGGKAFQADSAAQNIQGSFAQYEKQVDTAGNTLQYTKTTFGPNGEIIHVKDKITGQTFIPGQ